MHQTLQQWLKPILTIMLVSLMVPAIALAQAELGSDPSSKAQRLVTRVTPLPSAATLLDLRNTLLLGYFEQSLEREMGGAIQAISLPKPIRKALRRAPVRAIESMAPRVSASRSASVGAGGYVPHSGADWSAIAMCESSGNWSANTGNGFWGGLQFTPSTWFAYGGGPFDGVGPFPYSSSAQIAVGERVLASQGPGAWPNCFQWA